MAAANDARTPFEDAMFVEPLGEGRYRAVVDATWSGPSAPNGGVLAAVMVRAAQAELGPVAPVARTVSAHYLEAPAPGPVQIAVDVLRRGKRVAVCDVRMRDADRLVAQMTLVCSSSRPQERDLASEPPDAPPFDAVDPVDLGSASAAPPLFRQLELRPVFGSANFRGAANAVTGGWFRLRHDDAPLDAARLCALCDLWLPAIFGWLTAPAGVPTLQLTVYLRSTAQDVHAPVLARFETRTISEGHLEERGQLWSSEGRLLAESHQLALLLTAEPHD